MPEDTNNVEKDTDSERNEMSVITIIKGIIGAILGTLPSVILWVALGKTGYVAAIGGFFMIIGEMYICDRMTRKNRDMNIETALVICIIVMIVTIYICERIIWSWELCDLLSPNGPTLVECFLDFKSILTELEITSAFDSSLFKSYIFAALGAIAGIVKIVRS